MRERAEPILKLACWVLAAWLGFELVRAFVRSHPFGNVIIPAVPVLAADTNALAGPATEVNGMPPGFPGSGPSAPGTKPGTNLGTNLPIAGLGTTNGTNAAALTNRPVATNLAGGKHITTTNLVGGTNLATGTNSLSSTNLSLGTNGNAHRANAGTNAPGNHKRSSLPGGPHFPMMGMGGMGMGQSQPELPPLARARIDAIVASAWLGPVMHPLPKALLGIAGNVAFLRSDSGETGLVKVGDSVGDLKLLRIGINRVLVQQNGEPQELTIFDGMGGESLLNPTDSKSHETTSH